MAEQTAAVVIDAHQLVGHVNLLRAGAPDHWGARIGFVQHSDQVRDQVGALQLDDGVGGAAGHGGPGIA
jgi:hypothetical protein